MNSEKEKECQHELEYYCTIDTALPGDIVSTAVFKCKKCGEEFLEDEIDEMC